MLEHYLRPSLELELIWASTTGSFCYQTLCCTMDVTLSEGPVAVALSGPSLEPEPIWASTTGSFCYLTLSYAMDVTAWRTRCWSTIWAILWSWR